MAKNSLIRKSGRHGHPTLTLEICFLWGYLKQRVYNPLPKTLKDLESNIVREVDNIPETMLKATFLNFRKRCELLISAGGGHIEYK